MDSKDNERPNVEFGHEDANGHGPTPQEANAPDGRDEALVSAEAS